MADGNFYRGQFARGDELKFLSHLDLVRLFMRTFRRASLPVAYSGGFNPQPKISFASALPLGVTSDSEYFDLVLTEPGDCEQLIATLNNRFPRGIMVQKLVQLSAPVPALMAVVDRAVYRAVFPTDNDRAGWKKSLNDILARKEILMERSNRHKKKTVNIRPLILALEFKGLSHGRAEVEFLVQTGNKGGVRVEEMTRLICGQGLCRESTLPRFHRQGLFIAAGDRLLSPLEALRSDKFGEKTNC